ncbi:MAG: glyoxylase-like metal-dependent hydrolase (beta-lactamase superfamily II) [Gammaproteobacteria bacterium]|jgi:glyoxylase-like metal-dependent hydrolase (beta-lactamase superfamily II)
MMNPNVDAFFDRTTKTITYIVVEPEGSHCAIIDSVLDYDEKSGRTNTKSADRLAEYIHAHELNVDWILETHAHADHLSAAQYLNNTLGGSIGIGANITGVQKTFGKLFNFGEEFETDGSQFDHLFVDCENFRIGGLEAQALHTPGHTPACLTYVIGDAAFVGDTLFMPDYGTARTDFPGGDAAILYQSIQKILDLQGISRMFLCHDYKAPGRDSYAWETTAADQRAHNIHIGAGRSETDFVAMRNARDKTLEVPSLLIPAVQVNIRAGALPAAENNGIAYLKIPMNSF